MTRPMTRQGFLLSAALAAGAAAGPGAGAAFAQAGTNDDEILNYALLLERIEARFYELALQRMSGLDGQTRRIVSEIRANESEHVEILTRLVAQFGATPVPEPELDFGDAFGSTARFLEVAQQLEDTGVAAYNGAAGRISDRLILEAAGAIAQVEARHAAMVAFLREEPVTPGAFDRGAPEREIRRRVSRFTGG